MRLEGQLKNNGYEFNIPSEGDIKTITVIGFTLDDQSKSAIKFATLKYGGLPLDVVSSFDGEINELIFCNGAKLHARDIHIPFTICFTLWEESSGFIEVEFSEPREMKLPLKDSLTYDFISQCLRDQCDNELIYTAPSGDRYMMVLAKYYPRK